MKMINSILWRYQNFVKTKLLPAGSSTLTPLQLWQAQFLAELMIYVLPLSVLVSIPSVVISIQEKLYIVAFFDIFAVFILFFVLCASSKRIRYKKTIILLSFYSLGLVLLYYLGWVGPGLIYLLSFSVLNALLINKKAGILTLLGNILILTILIIGSNYNLFKTLPLLNIEPIPAAIISLNYILINFILIIAISSLTKALEKQIGFERKVSQRLNHEIEQHKAARIKAEESDRLKSAFLANMSHEIRTPMNGVLGFAQLLKQGGLKKAERLDFIEIIEKSGERLLNIINNLIDISKIEANQVTVFKSQFNIHHRIKDICKFFAPEIELKGLELICDGEECSELLEINSDANKIDAILTNLIKNAIKFTDVGFIKVKCSHSKEKITISIEDSGIGIDENQKHRLFERFIQAESLRPTEGSGLGLAITKAYVEMLGGTITLESVKNKGSKFTIVLPLV